MLPEDERLSSWRLALLDGRLIGEGRGLVQLLGAMRITRPAARALGRVPVRLLDGVYAAVARRRSGLGRLVPSRPGPTRFP
jgi:hypothetical protein